MIDLRSNNVVTTEDLKDLLKFIGSRVEQATKVLNKMESDQTRLKNKVAHLEGKLVSNTPKVANARIVSADVTDVEEVGSVISQEDRLAELKEVKEVKEAKEVKQAKKAKEPEITVEPKEAPATEEVGTTKKAPAEKPVAKK